MKIESNYIFSAEKNAFFPVLLIDKYIAEGDWPEVYIEVSDDTFEKYALTQPPEGFIRGGDNKGHPVWISIPSPTKPELIERAEYKKQSLIAEVQSETEMLRTKLALGRIKENEKALLNAWLDYLDELEAVDVSTAPDIIWPVKPVA